LRLEGNNDGEYYVASKMTVSKEGFSFMTFNGLI